MNDQPMPTPTAKGQRRRAAVYVRMSSAPQDHSIQHQCAMLNEYAQAHDIEIVMMYADAGKSGLRINGREGLKGLLADVQSGAADFELVLVYDVSRWGRFQDIDESAYYEFLCRQAGVQVVYCAEQFIDDGSPLNALLKGVKRIMAAEYSRELGTKVLLAQCRFARLGYKQGGRPGYGLCRVPVAQDGQARTPLAYGERKPAATDRVALRHGSPDEVALVCRIYRLYTEDGWSDTRIAAQLRAEGLLNHMGRPWDTATVRRILTSPRYCGEIVFNQTTRRLRSKAIPNPEQLWVRCTEAITPMVSQATFALAQQIRKRRAEGPDREAVLAQLRAVFARHGKINAALCRTSSLPGKVWIRRLFGSYVQAYVAAGLPLQHTASGALGILSMHQHVDALLAAVTAHARQAGATIQRTEVWNVVRFNDALSVKVSVASYRRCPDAWRRWRIPLNSGAPADFVLCGLMDLENQNIDRYLLLSPAAYRKDSLYLRADKLDHYRSNCFSQLDDLFGLSSSPEHINEH
ncbi:recombinase family protein [Pseudoduganella violacea]|uniref:DNA invertase Pin-like site-specific DNA recombinase n=1 Tax=Pseudoduganella violacea TaxID=1715466 RepID=A0A7W5BFJ9_9BURK|nr:recombinase family protein [Pseudoduganella violacea]MBB3122203.1 DNA invertase Pin-like site-specific DNA recombinase [Pseudoduganella violacea]